MWSVGGVARVALALHAIAMVGSPPSPVPPPAAAPTAWGAPAGPAPHPLPSSRPPLFSTNHLGHFLLANLLLEDLQKAPTNNPAGAMTGA